MSELTVQEGLQDAIQQMSEFADADVVINDWGVLDNYVGDAPYVIISNSDSFVSRQDTRTPNTVWEINVNLFVKFEDYKDTYDDFRLKRQALIDLFNTAGSDDRSADGLAAVTIDEIRSDGPIEPYYDPLTPDEHISTALPFFIFQRLIFQAEEF